MGEAVGIMNWFLDEHATKFAQAQGADGFEWTRDGRDYCYIWVQAFIDDDLDQYYLLDVRTAEGEGPFNETRDFLLVRAGYAGRACCWQNAPIAFAAGTKAHRERDRLGLLWFVDQREISRDEA